MFETMHKLRMPILVLIVLGMSGFGIYGMLGSSGGPGEIENREEASFHVPGATPSAKTTLMTLDVQALREGFAWLQRSNPQSMMFIGFQLRLDQEIEPGSQEFLYAYAAMREAARHSGLSRDLNGAHEFVRVSEIRRRQAPEDAQVPVPESLVDFVADLFLTINYRGHFGGSVSQPDPAKVLETYQSRFPVITAEYVLWKKGKAEDYALPLDTEEGKATLLEWLKENTHVIRPIPAQGDLAVTYVHFGDGGTEFTLDTLKALDAKHADALAAITVTEEEVRTRYDANLAETPGANPWQWILDLEAKAREGNGGDQPTEFDTLKPHIERELKFAKLLGKVHEAAVAEGTTLEQAAAQFGFTGETTGGSGYVLAEKQDQQAIQTNPSWGAVNLWTGLQSEAVAKLGTEEAPGAYKFGQVVARPRTPAVDKGVYYGGHPLFDEPGRGLACVALMSWEKGRTPTPEEVLLEPYIHEAYQNAMVQEAFTKNGKTFREKIEAYLDAVPEVKAKYDAEVAPKIEEQIAERELSRENPEHEELISDIEANAKRTLDQDSDYRELRTKHREAAFRSVVQEMGLELHTYGPAEASQGTPPVWREDLSETERLNRYLRSNYVVSQVNRLKEGESTANPITDFQGGYSASFICTKRVEPTAEDMLRRPDRYRQIVQQLSNQSRPLTSWKMEHLRADAWFGLETPELTRREQEIAARTGGIEGGAAAREAERRRLLREAAQRNSQGNRPVPQPVDGNPTPDQTNPGR